MRTRLFCFFVPTRGVRRPYLRMFFALGVGLIPWVGETVAADAPPKPNVVFFLADDLGYMDIGANNPKTFYETPNIDGLAKKGVRFTSGYAACPVCSPTRASVLTGKYPQRVGITDYIGAAQPEKWARPTKLLPAPYQEELALGETTLAEAFKAHGYATFFAGKWHLGSTHYWPENQGFDHNLGGTDRGGPYGGNKYFSPYGNPRLPDGPPGEHLPDRLATETARFIEANRDHPFFAYLSFYSVHTPLMAREDLRKKYEAKAKTLVTNGPAWGQERERKVRMVQDHAVYAGMVEAMDQAVGKVLAALDGAGLAERTIVVFMSDNGGLSTSEGHPTSNLPLRAGKGWLYEGGIRAPWILRAPGVRQPGRACDTPVTSTDFYPTLLELAGLPALPAQHCDGVSLVPLLQGGQLARGPLFWHYPHYGNQGGAPGGAVRDGDWKLIEWYEDGSRELYNLRNDLGEQTNLAAKEPARVQALHAQLNAWRAEVGARMPTRKPARPNILHIHADDHRADGLHALGADALQTPHLDTLVERGMTFTHCYTMGSMIGAVCLPSRTMMFTGRSLFHIGGRAAPAPALTPLPTVLKAAGYQTWQMGKSGNECKAALQAFEVSLVDDARGKDERTSRAFSCRRLADRTIEFLRSRDPTRPFYIYLAPPVPHDPREAEPQFHKLYDPAKLPLPPAFLPQHPWNNGDMTVRDEKLAPWPRTPEDTRQQLADYYACITGLDHHVGRVFEALKQSGQFENTIVVFTGDNGLSLGEHGLFGKQNLYEFGGMHVPLVLAGPGIPKGRSEALVYLMDLFPTFCDFAGAIPPAGTEGRSLRPIMEGKASQVRDVLYTAYQHSQRAIRDHRWKLIRYPLVDRTQLFDLAADPRELRNLAGEAAHAAKVNELTTLLQQEMQRYDDPTPLRVANPAPAEWAPPSR